MSNELMFAAGTIVTVLLAIPAFFAAKSVYTKRQNQKVHSGRGYQAGGDINIQNDK